MQKLIIFGARDAAAARCDHAAGALAKLGQHLRFDRTEGILSFPRKKRRNGAAQVPLDLGVGVEKRSPEALRQQPSGRAYKVILPTAAADAVMADPGLARELSASALELGNSELGLASNTKKAGIRAVLSALGPDAGTTYGFGDAENDLPLFAEVDVRVAMGNAVDALKARADYVTGSVHEDGVVSGLAHFGLI